MVDVEGTSGGHLVPTPLLKQGYLKPVAQGYVQMAFEYLQRGRVCKLPGEPVPVFGYSYSREVFPDIQIEPPVFQFVSIASCPVLGTTEKSLALSSL